MLKSHSILALGYAQSCLITAFQALDSFSLRNSLFILPYSPHGLVHKYGLIVYLFTVWFYRNLNSSNASAPCPPKGDKMGLIK